MKNEKSPINKQGMTALGWTLVIVLSIALMGIVLPRLERATYVSTQPVTNELTDVMNTSGDNPVINHKSTDE